MAWTDGKVPGSMSPMLRPVLIFLALALGPVLSAALTSAGVPHEALFDWGGGLVWLLMPSVSADTVRHEVAALGGHATLVRATQADRAAVPVFQPEPAPLAAITTGLRQRFDPRGLLNPGLMG